MSVDVSWLDSSKTAVLQVYHGGLNARDMFQGAHKSAELMSTVTHLVDVILDVTDLDVEPINLIGTLTQIDHTIPANQDQVVIIGAPRFMTTLVKLAAHFAPRATANVSFVSTRAQALDLLEHKRRS